MSCRKEGSYRTLKKARETIRYMREKGYDKLVPYFCHECREWHLSSERMGWRKGRGKKKFTDYKKSKQWKKNKEARTWAAR